jgi:hypothetical protein
MIRITDSRSGALPDGQFQADLVEGEEQALSHMAMGGSKEAPGQPLANRSTKWDNCSSVR